MQSAQSSRNNDFWSFVPEAISRVTTAARAVRESAVATYLYEIATPVLNFAFRVTCNALTSAVHGFSQIFSLYQIFYSEFSKKTRALLRRMSWQTVSYAAIPFVYYSALQPKLKDTAWLSTADYLAFSFMAVTFVRRLIDYGVGASLIPRAIEQDNHFQWVSNYLRDVFNGFENNESWTDGIADLFARYLAKGPLQKEFRDFFYNLFVEKIKVVDLRRWDSKRTAVDFEKGIFETLFYLFSDSSSKVAPFPLANNLSPILSKIILTALDIVLNKKPLEKSLFATLADQYQADLKKVFSGLVRDDGPTQLARGIIDEIAKSAEKMKKSIPADPYLSSEMNLSQKMRSLMQGPIYLVLIPMLAAGFKLLFFILLPSLFFIAEFSINSILLGYALWEYQLAAYGMSVSDRYQFFSKRNFACLGMGVSQLLSISLITWAFDYFYGVASFFLSDAISNFIIHLHLNSLFSNKKPVPEEILHFDPSKKIRGFGDRVLNLVLARFQPKVKRLNDEIGRQKIITKIKTLLTSRFLICIAAITLTDSRSKYLFGKALEIKNLNLLKVSAEIPAVKMLLKEYAPDMIGIVEKVRYACQQYLSVANYIVWLSSVLLSVSFGTQNTIAGVLFTAAKFATLSTVVFLVQILNQEGFDKVLLDLEMILKDMIKQPESVLARPIVSLPVAPPSTDNNAQKRVLTPRSENEEKERERQQQLEKYLDEAMQDNSFAKKPAVSVSTSSSSVSTRNLFTEMSTANLSSTSSSEKKRCR